MQGFIIIAIIWLVFSALVKGARNAQNGSRNQRGGRPGAAPPASPRSGPVKAPPLTPAARPGSGAPDWSELMTMLSGAQQKPEEPEAPGMASSMEGVSTESEGSFKSVSGATLLDGGKTLMDGQPDYEGRSLPGEPSANAVARLPKSEPAPAQTRPAPAAPRRSPASMRDAVVWAEILARPRALQRRRAVR